MSDQKKQQEKTPIALREEDVLKFWNENKIFEKSVETPAGNDDPEEFTFYDGPPFATGTPHYGHLLQSFVKDAVPRYKTMQGLRVKRQWGWDCHGLPIENIVEKELGISGREDIKKVGIKEFNDKCRAKIFEYEELWKQVIPRIGRWADMDNPYKTMDTDYMESEWWAFKELYKKGLVYENYRSMHICPRCETTLSQSEVTEGYKDIKDLSVTAKFELVDEPNTFVLAWTTTPWTLPGNVALAVGEDIEYVKVEEGIDSKQVFLISGKYDLASKEYYPNLKKELEKQGYEVKIIDHVESSNPQLDENLNMLGEHDFKNAHVVVHSLANSTFLKYLEGVDTKIASLTMIAPSYPGKSFSSKNIDWVENSGYVGIEVDFENIKTKILNTPNLIYSDEGEVKEKYFLTLGEKIGANIHREPGKKHFFAKEYTNIPDFNIDFSEKYIVAKKLAEKVFEGKEYEVVAEFKGKDLVGKSYKPLFDYYAKKEDLENKENGWKIYAADFISDEDGTGIAHEAPAFGEEDMALGKLHNLPFVQHVQMNGLFSDDVADFKGLNVKPKEDHMATDIEIIKWLAHNGKLFEKKKYEHSYPHCWRCKTPLLNYATSSWFVKVEEQKEALLKNAEPINWSPKHMKAGRWGKWLEGARDWSISRNRFWANTMPVWRCDNDSCDKEEVLGSIDELEEKSRVRVTDLHKDVVDEITWKCECGGEMHRISDVLDTWFNSGSVPYATLHYPFENKEEFEKRSPVDFIAEGQDQTRTWFYYQHVLATGLFDRNAFKNVITTGIMLAEDGKKMSKSLQNYPDPMYIINTYGADATRLYVLQSPAVRAENLSFSEKEVGEIARKLFGRLLNVYELYTMFKDDIDHRDSCKSEHVLDRWIIARLRQLHNEITEAMENYELDKATRGFSDFVDDLSTWYIRRSRDRFKGDDEADKKAALETTRFVLRKFAKLLAPFAPFHADWLWQNTKRESDAESVHLTNWCSLREVDEAVLEEMEEVRKIVSLAFDARKDAGFNVRQPLATLKFLSSNFKFLKKEELLQIIAEEVNIKQVLLSRDIESDVWIDTHITPELKEEGELREVIRALQGARKKADLQQGESAQVKVIAPKETQGLIEKYKEDIEKQTTITGFEFKEGEELEIRIKN